MNYPIEDLLKQIDFSINEATTTYHNKDGVLVPRVTEVLSTMYHNDRLMYWANNLGFKRLSYKKELDKAANTGSVAHTAIEHYLKDDISIAGNYSFDSFLAWWDKISKNNTVEIVSIERKLICDWYGGTLDCLLCINGKLFLIDFKTSNFVGFKHFLQLAAYRYALYITEGINIDGCIVLQLSKDSVAFNEYAVFLDNNMHYKFMEYCTECFLSMLYSYYQIRRVQMDFNKLFGG